MSLKLHSGELISWAKSYDGPKFHVVLTDPPYGLEFMGQEWDAHDSMAAYQRWTTEWASAMLPLLHPGALVFSFGGTRTFGRLQCGFEDAGFETLDCLMWLYGQGFPKAQGIDGLVDKENGASARSHGFKVAHGQNYKPPELQHRSDYGGHYEAMSEAAKPWAGHKTPALKPAWEPILVFRAPRQGKTYAELAMEHGSGAYNIDGARIPMAGEVIHTPQRNPDKRAGIVGTDLGISRVSKEQFQASQRASTEKANQMGRYPSNLILDEEAGRLLDEQVGESPAGVAVRHRSGGNTFGSNNPKPPMSDLGYGDRGGASRFFYQSKASRSEREAGCDKLENQIGGTLDGGHIVSEGRTAPKTGRVTVKNSHPTVKPISVTRWLATLLLPPDSVKPRRLLVPFAGSGSEMIGAIQAGWDEVVGVEQDEHYCQIADARIAYWKELGTLPLLPESQETLAAPGELADAAVQR